MSETLRYPLWKGSIFGQRGRELSLRAAGGAAVAARKRSEMIKMHFFMMTSLIHGRIFRCFS
jgi:hypothetical protein